MRKTYTNPVYPQYFADPFVLDYDQLYYAYGTAPASSDGLQFPVLRSADLIHWNGLGWALAPVEGASTYWAPEVVFQGGKFYMYYSAGIEDKNQRLRVAVSEHPAGLFVDSGNMLAPEAPFTIDAHPFQDVDDQWYLFYARDFLESEGDYRIGTGIVVDRLIDMVRLAGDPHVVTRPHADWHLFRAQRAIYGGIYDWHTIEGPALRVHGGRYYCFYSGGAWERDNYGVSYVVADHPLGPYTRPKHLSGPLLGSVPGQVRGPGHNSFITTPDGSEYIIYHAWDSNLTARLMRIDRLRWEPDHPMIDGPTWTPQPAPIE